MGFFGKLFGKKTHINQNQQQCPSEGYPNDNEQPADDQTQLYDGQEQNIEGERQPNGEYITDASANGETECAESEQQNVPAWQNNEVSREEYIVKFRAEFKHHFPKRLDTVENHMQLPYMICAAVDISPVIEFAATDVYERFRNDPDKLSELSRAAVAKVAMFLEKFIGEQEPGYFEAFLMRAHGDSLEKAWIVLDFYCRMLKAEYTEKITVLYGLVTDELVKRTLNPALQARNESYEDVLAKCARLVSTDAASEELPELKKRLFEKLLELDTIYVIHDEAFNNTFPYIGADGRLEIQTTAEHAQSLKVFLEKNGDSKVSISEYKKEQYETFFKKIFHLGLTVIRLDNGFTPVEIDINDVFDDGEKNLVEVCNRYARSCFISELQYGYRIKNLLGDKHDTEDYRVLSAAMIKARSNGYRALAGGLVYVFNIGGENHGTTLYTPKALENASEIMKIMGIIDESTLIAPGDTAFDVFNGEIALRSVSRKDSTPDKGFICAFTDIENAEKIHKRFVEAGANDSVIVMTLGELCRSCGECAGFILDMSSYGLEIPKEMFGKISEIAKTNGIIVGGKEIEL